MQEFETREDMLRSLVGKNGSYVEVGVFEGTFSHKIQTILSPTVFVLIDVFEGRMGSGDQDGNNFKMIDLHESYVALKRQDVPGRKLLKGWSYEWLPVLHDDSYDMIYLDADHSYEGTLRDLRLSYPKVRHGGWLMGHDYAINSQKTRNWYDFGVRRAVDEFCKESGQRVEAIALDGCISFAIRVDKLRLGKEDAGIV